MSLPSLYAQPSAPEDWRRWSFNHAANHYDIVAAADQQYNTSTTLATNAVSSAGSKVIQFESVPSSVAENTVQLGVVDLTNDVIPTGTIVTGYSSTEVQISNAVTGGGVQDGDSIQFAPVTPVNLDQFQLDPMDLNNLGLWIFRHQLMHSEINAILGTQGYDLTSLDWTDPDQLAEWLRLNGDEHVRISAALGVGA